MKRWVWFFLIAVLPAGCASPERTAMFAPYEQSRPVCREYARQMVGEADEESRYRECIAWHVYQQSTIDKNPFTSDRSR